MTTVELGDLQAWLRAERGRQIRMRAVPGGYAVTLRERPAGGAEIDRVVYGETLEAALDAAFVRKGAENG